MTSRSGRGRRASSPGIGPVVAVGGTVAVILVLELTVKLDAATPLKSTLVAPVSREPFTVTLVQAVALLGVNDEMAGARIGGTRSLPPPRRSCPCPSPPGPPPRSSERSGAGPRNSRGSVRGRARRLPRRAVRLQTCPGTRPSRTPRPGHRSHSRPRRSPRCRLHQPVDRRPARAEPLERVRLPAKCRNREHIRRRRELVRASGAHHVLEVEASIDDNTSKRGFAVAENLSIATKK